MSTAVSEPSARKAKAEPRTPPEEQFWKRYSPHGEAPLSLAGSLGLHALAFGGLLLFGVYLVNLLVKPQRNIPVEPVRLAGGGGAPGGKCRAAATAPGPRTSARSIRRAPRTAARTRRRP
jgi:hypothetical protein